MRVLVIDDEPKLAGLIGDGLRGEGSLAITVVTPCDRVNDRAAPLDRRKLAHP